MNGADAKAIADWLIDGARSAPDKPAVLAQLCDRLVERGLPLWRVALLMFTLHPQLKGRCFRWKEGEEVEILPGDFDYFATSEHLASPFKLVLDTGVPLRRPLEGAIAEDEFEVIRELKAQGATDYLAMPLFFADGTTHCVTFATRSPGGFSDAHLEALNATAAPLARVIETHALRRRAGTLLDTYIGVQAGSRVLEGQIRRGHTIAINAAIWLSDMRGFTRLADRLPPRTLIDHLNRYFDCQVPAILEHGGEVLKFMGDGLLAIFPTAEDGRDVRVVCDAALTAARKARREILHALAPSGETSDGGPPFGLALHVGEVLYGNIGSENRLDFTCIGPAVNLAARIEKLTAKLGRTILASEEFAHSATSGFVRLGEFDLPGFEMPRTIFTLDDEER